LAHGSGLQPWSELFLTRRPGLPFLCREFEAAL